jgi:hypothetical protein
MRRLFIIIMFLIIAKPSFAINSADVNCSASNTFCAASCSLSDLQAAVDKALNSKLPDVIVYIPSKGSPATWVEGTKLSINADSATKVHLIGSGVQTTDITNFQIDLPSNGVSNLVEVADFSAHGNGKNSSFGFMDYRLRPPALWDELYWHDLVISNYGANYTLHFEGWKGLISHLDLTCVDDPTSQNDYGIVVHGDGTYSEHKDEMGSNNPKGNVFYIEDSTISNCSHSVSLFCDAYVVFRHNTVSNADAYLDIHGPGYNYCYYSGTSDAGGGYEVYDNDFYNYKASWHIAPRAGSAGIITGNRFHSGGTYGVALQAQETCQKSVGCGDGPGETYKRVDSTSDGPGCLQMLENWWIWNNDCSEAGCADLYLYEDSACGSPLRENIDYFRNAPKAGEPVQSWTPFTYPNPLRITGLPMAGTGLIAPKNLRIAK